MAVATDGSDDSAAAEPQSDATERELLALLDADNLDEATRKRKLVSLFDRFRVEYTNLSVQLRESLQTQRRLMDKCVQMKNELVACALKVRATQQAQLDEIQSLSFYRDECEHAWQQSNLSRERERDAVRIVEELRAEIDQLQLQVKTLITPTGASSALEVLGLHRKALKSPGKSAGGLEAMSFEEWKAATRVWCPSWADAPRTAATPTQASLATAARSEEIARCASVPSLRPTPMERAATAAAAAAKPRSSHGPRQAGTFKVLASPPRKAGRGLPAVSR